MQREREREKEQTHSEKSGGKKEKKIANRNREFIVNELGQGANAVAEAREEEDTRDTLEGTASSVNDF